jgi:hypothetical protein
MWMVVVCGHLFLVMQPAQPNDTSLHFANNNRKIQPLIIVWIESHRRDNPLHYATKQMKVLMKVKSEL